MKKNKLTLPRIKWQVYPITKIKTDETKYNRKKVSKKWNQE